MLYLAGRSRLLGEAPAFAPACMAAGISAGFNPWAMLAGAAAGGLQQGGETGWLAPLACALVFLITALLRAALRLVHRPQPHPDALCALSSGAGLLIACLPFCAGSGHNLLICCLSSVVSMCLAPALTSGMGVRPSRTRLTPEERLSLSLLLTLLLVSLRAAPYAGLFLSQAAAVLMTLIFSGAGPAMGALAGLMAGTALRLGGSDPFMGAALGVCGLLAGCAKTLPRAMAGLVFALGNLLTVSWGVGYTIGAADFEPLAVGCALYCLISPALLRRLRGWLQSGETGGDAERIAVRLRQKAGRRLGEIGEIFGELADGCGEEPVLPCEQQIISSLRQALCDGCGGYARCWLGDHPRAGRLMCRMAAEALSGMEITPARSLPPDLIRHCRRSGQIDRRVLPLLQSLAETRLQALRRGEARSLMGRQFREAQRLLNSLSTQMKGGVCISRENAATVRAALDRAGVEAGEITAVLDDRMEIVCALKRPLRNPADAKRAALSLTDELGVPFSPVITRGDAADEFELRLRQAPALTASFASACRAAQPDAVCGDSHLLTLLPDGRLIAALSDGMGHGERAAAESRRCISLLRKFVSAGVEKDAALTAVNSLLMMREGEEMFATADLCVVDLFSGTASMSKLGACASYILSEKGLKTIAGGRLPLGILDRVEPAHTRAEVHPGDLIIMISDGVADEWKENQTAAFGKLLPRLRRLPPERAAQRIMDWARQERRPAHSHEPDDMTVIVIRILARRMRME